MRGLYIQGGGNDERFFFAKYRRYDRDTGLHEVFVDAVLEGQTKPLFSTDANILPCEQAAMASRRVRQAAQDRQRQLTPYHLTTARHRVRTAYDALAQDARDVVDDYATAMVGDDLPAMRTAKSVWRWRTLPEHLIRYMAGCVAFAESDLLDPMKPAARRKARGVAL